MRKENIVEMNEAIIAGKKAQNSMRAAKEALVHAGDWGIVDLLGGGLFVDMIKHSKLRDAEEKLQDAKNQVEIFQCEIKDVELDYQFNIEIDTFLTFADFFLDGLIADWLVQSKINAAKEEVEHALERVEEMVLNLQAWEKEILSNQKGVK